MRYVPATLLLLAIAAPARAQQSEPLPPFVIDARGAYSLLKRDPVTAETLGVEIENLATHAFGVAFGIETYPLRRRAFAFGLGSELALARGTKQNLDKLGNALGPDVRRQFQSLSVQLSLNFGHRDGWSYLTAGIGPVSFDSYLRGTLPDGPRQLTQNFGFGARWFNTAHLAFTVDLRFYLVQPSDPTRLVGGRERRSVTFLSAGVSIK